MCVSWSLSREGAGFFSQEDTLLFIIIMASNLIYGKLHVNINKCSFIPGSFTRTQASETVGRLSRLLGVYPNSHNKKGTALITFDEQISKTKDYVMPSL